MRSAELTLPGLRPRRVLDGPGHARLASPFFRGSRPRSGTAWSWSTRRCRSPIRSTTAAPRCSSGPSTRRPRASGATGRRTGGCSVRSSATPTGSCRTSSARRCACRATRSRWPGSASRHCGRRRGWRDGASGTMPARALLGGLSAHSMVALDRPPTASFGLVLAMTAHAYGWPFVRGGTQRLADALAAELRPLGGEIVTGHPVTTLRRRRRPRGRPVRHDAASAAGHRRVAPAGGRYRRRLGRLPLRPGRGQGRLGARRADPVAGRGAARAGTVHVGGTLDEIAAAEAEVAAGGHPERPFVLVVQPSLFDPSRAPAGKHTGWAYCHVPERLDGRHVEPDRGPDRAVRAGLPRPDPGALGAAAGRPGARQPELRRRRHQRRDRGHAAALHAARSPGSTRTPRPRRGIYLCSSSTPPGGGVHGMCGVWAARSALRREFGVRA